MGHIKLLLLTALLPVIIGVTPPPADEITKRKYEAVFGVFNSTVDLTPGNRFSGNNKEVACVTDENEEGVCVLYYQCDIKSHTVITGGATLFDLREKSCPLYNVCCLLNKVKKNSTNSGTTESIINKLNGTIQTAADDFGCGWGNAGAMDVRLKGNSSEATYAEYGEFPWMVALLRRTEEGAAWSENDYIGGGSIIHPSVVLTAAHKVDTRKPSEVKCRAGEWDTQTILESYPHQERNVKKIVVHEELNRQSVYNDIALLFLEKPYDLDDAPHMGVVCLGNQMPPPGTKCYSMGWGKKEFNSKSKNAVILKKVGLSTVSSEQCEARLKTTRLGQYFILDPSLTCAGGKKGEDTCTGDGGSPLVCPITSPGSEGPRFAVYGLVAYGLGCGEDGIPGVYVNVPYLYDWVGRKMAAEGYDAKSYKF